MAGTIYIAMSDIPLEPYDKKHLYLVYDADGDPSTTGDQEVIRGGPGGLPGDILIESGVTMSSSADNYGAGEDHTDRHFTELDIGVADASDVWGAMEDAAEALGSLTGGKYETDLAYYLLSQNSNSVINTVLYQTGFDLRDDAPEYYGTDDKLELFDAPGHNTLLGTDGIDTWDIEIEGKRISIADQGGDDSYTIDMDGVQDGILTINETSESGSDDVLTLENVDPEDVGVFKSADGKHLIVTANGKVVAWVPGQFDEANSRINDLTVVPTVGSPETIPVDDPDDIPTLNPQAVPGWGGAIEDDFGDSKSAGSPLVLDLAGTGINLAALGSSGSVYWNITEGDFSNESGWIASGTGLLAIDLNDDGIINDHSELFGTLTTDGFSVLSAYDTNTDDVITSSDDDWDDLLVWTDDNSDGFSQSSELHSLDSLLITQIDLNASSVSYDIAGNHVTHESTFTIDGNTHDIVDAWFAYDEVNTAYVADYELDPRTLNLATLRGYGDLADLHIAMSLDETLLEMVQSLAMVGLSKSLDHAEYDFGGAVREVMYRWAGVHNVDPSSRGVNIDAQKLGFLEAFMGQDWEDDWSVTDPGTAQADLLHDAWNTALDQISARLSIQGSRVNLFSGDITFDPFADSIEGVTGIDLTKIEDLSGSFDHSDEALSLFFWKELLGTIEGVIGLDNLSQGDIDDLDDIIQNDDPHGTFDYDTLVELFGDTGYVINGDSNDNLLIGQSSNNVINGYAGDDVLVGGRGGTDALYGGADDDTYVFDVGDAKFANDAYLDSVNESLSEGTDTIYFGAGIDPDTVRLWANNQGHVYIQYTNTDFLYVQAGQSNGETQIGSYVEQIVFADSSTWDLTGGLIMRNKDGGGSIFGSGYDDSMEGGEGAAEYLYGKSGNDILTGHVDFEALYGGVGNDTYVFNLGDSSNGGESYGDAVNESLSEGTDKILFTDGIDPDDIRSWTDYSGTLYIKYSSSDYIKVQGSVTGINFGEVRVGDHLEQIEFADETVWDLTNGLNLKGDDVWRQIFGSANGDVMQLGSAGGRLYGNDGDDTLVGGSSTGELLYGGNGADILYGSGGGDVLFGEAGDDLYVYGEGMDTLTDTGGSDTIWITGGITINDISFSNYSSYDTKIVLNASVDEVFVTNLRHGTASNHIESLRFDDGFVTDQLPDYSSWFNGTSGNDTVTGNGSDNVLIGFAGDDDMDAGAGADDVHGGAGADTINGDGGNDLLYGGDGDDTIDGDADDDVLYGGDGLDTLWGGSGSDTFLFRNEDAFSDVDVVKDFDVTTDDDVIDITDILSINGYEDGVDTLTDWVEITTNGSDSDVKVDITGSASFGAGTQIATLEGITGLTDEAALVSSGNLLVA